MAGPSGTKHSSASQAKPETRTLLEQASHTAEQFVSLYYSASDSPSRSSLVPTLYLSNSTIVWNGNPIQGQEGVRELIDRMPFTRYEVTAVDCQPVGSGGSSGSEAAPSLMLTVSGTVTHHTSTSYTAQPESNAPSVDSKDKKRKSGTSGNNTLDPSLPLDSLPRAFSQTFVLVDQKSSSNEGGIVVAFEEDGSGSGKGKDHSAPQSARYFVLADNFRFVG